MAPIPEMMDQLWTESQWTTVALGLVATVCVSLSVVLIVILCGGGKPAEEKPKEEAPPAPAGDAAPAADAAPPAEEPKQPSNKEAPAAKEAKGGGSQKAAPSAVSGKGPELKLTSEKPATTIGGKSGKGGTIDLKKQPSLQLQAATTKK